MDVASIDEIPGLVMIKLLDLKSGYTNMIKVKFMRNTGFIKVSNKYTDPLIFNEKEALGVADLRFIGHYQVKQTILQYHLKPDYEFKSLQVLFQEFIKLMKTLKTEEQQSNDSYPWLAEDDERRNATDREILDRYIDLETSCLTQKEMEDLMDMFYGFKKALHLRDETVTCPNIELEIGLVDKTPLSIRPYHVKEDKQILDKEIKILYHLGILKERFFTIPQSSYVNK